MNWVGFGWVDGSLGLDFAHSIAFVYGRSIYYICFLMRMPIYILLIGIFEYFFFYRLELTADEEVVEVYGVSPRST